MDHSAAPLSISEEDRLRASWYSLLGRLLSAPADEDTLRTIAALPGDQTDLGQGVAALATAARATTPVAVREEYFALFIGLGKGELLPFASYYLTGFLNEKPLAVLRSDMAQLGIVRDPTVPEPEDHIAALCEMMAGLITGAFGEVVSLDRQRAFFDKHIGCWAPRFFEDLQAARSAAFFMPVGTLGRQFIAIESQAFDMAA